MLVALVQAGQFYKISLWIKYLINIPKGIIMTIERLKELAGIITEAKEEKLHGLYVGKKGSGKLGLQHSGTKDECHQEWKDTKHDYEKGHVHKVAPIEHDKQDQIDEGEDAIEDDSIVNEDKDKPTNHHLSFKCPSCNHAWSVDAKVNRDDDCPKCGDVSKPIKDVTESNADLLEASDKIKKGAFHKWLGKPEDEKITQADIERGLKSDDPHVRKMAQYVVNVEESLNEVAPPDEEKFVKDSKEDFKKRYGKRWKRVLYATAWNKHKKDANESMDDFADRINALFEYNDRLAELSGIDILSEEEKFKIERVQYAHPPANLYQLKAVEVNDDYMEVKKELTGMDKNEAQKVKVPKSVNKAIDKRIKELEGSIEKYGGGGPQETALDELKEFKRLLSSENLEDYQAAQVKYGTLWTEIEELLPTLLVNFLHTGKELENIKVQ
jgi:uncharacterized protein (DUF983 family)